MPGGPVVKTSPFNAGCEGSFPGWGTKIPHASWTKNKYIKQKQYCNKFNKDFKNGPHRKNLLRKSQGKREMKSVFTKDPVCIWYFIQRLLPGLILVTII